MKFLISDYSSPTSTEPLYLNTTLNMIGCASTLWNLNSASAYDMFDIVKPDIHISHVNYLSNDSLLYLKENKNIEVVINITGIRPEEFLRLESILNNYDINLKFYFTNNHNHKLKSKTNILALSHGADIYFKNQGLKYNIENGIIINSKNQIQPIGNTYHYITLNKDLVNDVDIAMPVINLAALYKNYNKIIIKYFDNYLPQYFFDAHYYGNDVTFEVENNEQLATDLLKLFGSDGINDVKNLVKKKHTCLHRTKSLLSQFPAKEYIDKLSTLTEEILK